MQEKDRSTYLNTIQKHITSNCFDRCGTRKPCLDICYKKYLATVNTTNEAVKQKGYETLSTLAYKASPQQQIDHLLYHTGALLKVYEGVPYAVSGNHAV